MSAAIYYHPEAYSTAGPKMYQALEAAAQATGQTVVLVECGWHANAFMERAYAQAAQRACPSVKSSPSTGATLSSGRRHGPQPMCFCSLSDNIQESFGIMPMEAMAAGLSVSVPSQP